MSNEWTAEMLLAARQEANRLVQENPKFSRAQGVADWLFAACNEIERLQAENAALQARVPAEGDVVLVDREHLLDWYEEMPNWDCAAQIRACLDAPKPRVVRKEDVVEDDEETLQSRLDSVLRAYEQVKDHWLGADVIRERYQREIDALARAIGGQRCDK